jgi:hypothetical protein
MDDHQSKALFFLLDLPLQESPIYVAKFLDAELVATDEHAGHISEFVGLGRPLFWERVEQLHCCLRIIVEILIKIEGVGLIIGALFF